ncbi:hypothetical protein B484DRAFT_450627 [Ochromonadaceae sp. CCMP2298]|nr:hypothetical protein B484DRAFT_450627 [Ochromonadaceae sp. CCMP2298]|mmetsp:Transcript_23670/g.52609  ORF Transcript_23670/g.52609 Transcript_23670/m.52609 type:complete len:395 (+) Transcript_23670:79-1263(+)
MLALLALTLLATAFAADDYRILVSIKTCDTQFGGSKTPFEIGMTFPNMPAYTLQSTEFSHRALHSGQWYTVLTTVLAADFSTFTEVLNGFVTITAMDEDALCIEEARVNGVMVDIKPVYLDNPCTSPTYSGYICSKSVTGLVALNPPTHPVDFTFQTCSVEGAGTTNVHTTVAFLTQKLKTTLDFTPSLVGGSNTMRMYLADAGEDEMQIQTNSADGWCIAAVTAGNTRISFASTWLDTACAYVDQFQCSDHITNVFTIPDVSIVSDACSEWLLGYSGESCTKTCSRIRKQCALFPIEMINTLEAMTATIESATSVVTLAPLGSFESFCNGGVNTWALATAPAVLDAPMFVAATGVTEMKHSCFYPNVMVGDCDTKFNVPMSQRLCACGTGSKC